MNWNAKTLTAINGALQRGAVTHQQLVSTALATIKAHQDLNATTLLRTAAAVQLARHHDQHSRPVQHQLWGIPFAAKDNFSVTHEVTTASCAILRNYVSPVNARVIDCLLASGANLVCKTTMDELGMGGHGLYASTGWVVNPYDHQRISGGSSSGSAVLVAIGAVSYALGTDTGDSIRKPAAYCGVVGFKPTYGLVSRYGVIPFAPSLDTVGFLCRSVVDCGLILNTIAGYDQQDFSSYQLPSRPDYRLAPTLAVVKHLKVVYFSNLMPYLDAPLRASYHALFTFLRGHQLAVTGVVLPTELLTAIPVVYQIISCAEASSTHANLDGINFGVRITAPNPLQVMLRSRSRAFGSELKKRFVFGAFCLKRENQQLILRKAQTVRTLLRNFMQQLWQQHDILIMPASTNVAPLIVDVKGQRFDQQQPVEDLMALANLVGFPSLTIPLTLRQGLPIGVNLNAACFQEQKLLRVAQLIEHHTRLVNLQVPTPPRRG